MKTKKTKELQKEIDHVRETSFADDPDEAPARLLAQAIYEHLYFHCVKPPESEFEFDLLHLLRDAFNRARKTGPLPAQIREETWRAAVMACLKAFDELPIGVTYKDMRAAMLDVLHRVPT